MHVCVFIVVTIEGQSVRILSQEIFPLLGKKELTCVIPKEGKEEKIKWNGRYVHRQGVDEKKVCHNNNNSNSYIMNVPQKSLHTSLGLIFMSTV